MLHSTRTQTVTTTTISAVPTRLHGEAYQARVAQAEAIKTAILAAGQTEPGHPLRVAVVDGEPALVDVFAHPAGCVIRFHIHEGYRVKVRELLLLPTQESYSVWLAAEGKLFPHSGKYFQPALRAMTAILADV